MAYRYNRYAGLRRLVEVIRADHAAYARRQGDRILARLSESMNNRDELVTVVCQGRLFKIKVGQIRRLHGGGLRGLVTGFSAASRKRLLEKMAIVDFEALATQRTFCCKFITLTYREEFVPPDKVKRDLELILKRLEYYATQYVARRVARGRRVPDDAGHVCGIWRLEYQERGSPHMHIMVWGLPYLHHSELNRIWREVAGYAADDYVRTEIKKLIQWKKAIYYCSKYIAKVDKGNKGAAQAAKSAGRGPRPGEGPGANDAAQPPSLVIGAYLEKYQTHLAVGASVGRQWGLFGRKYIKYYEKNFIRFEFGSWFWQVKRAARRLYRWIYPGCTGFTLMLDIVGGVNQVEKLLMYAYEANMQREKVKMC